MALPWGPMGSCLAVPLLSSQSAIVVLERAPPSWMGVTSNTPDQCPGAPTSYFGPSTEETRCCNNSDRGIPAPNKNGSLHLTETSASPSKTSIFGFLLRFRMSPRITDCHFFWKLKNIKAIVTKEKVYLPSLEHSRKKLLKFAMQFQRYNKNK